MSSVIFALWRGRKRGLLFRVQSPCGGNAFGVGRKRGLLGLVHNRKQSLHIRLAP